MLAVDQTLHFLVKVLHPHAHAIKAFAAQVIQHIQLDFTRVQLNANFSLRQDVEVFPQQCHQAGNLRFTQEGRRTATPVDLRHLTSAKQLGAGADLLLQHVQIVVGFMSMTGDDFIAAAEVTQLMAKRDVYV